MKQENSGLKNAVLSQRKLLLQSSMGNSLSLSGKNEITGQELQLSSKEISTMSNDLFRFMYSSWKPRDVWDIAENPDKYVIAISDMITTEFHVLGYKKRDKRMGEIYFRKWSDLEPPMKSESNISLANSRNEKSLTNIRDSEVQKRLKIELSKRKTTRRQRSQAGFPAQKQNAEIIAFYFVRIFQILGAMLLVVKDIELPEYDEKGEPTGGLTSENQAREFAKQLYPSQLRVNSFKPSTISLNDKRKLEIAEKSAMIADMRLKQAEAAFKEAQSKLSKNKSPGIPVEVQTNQVATQAGGGNFDAKLALGPYEFLRYYLRNIEYNDKIDLKNNGITKEFGSGLYMFDKSRLLFFKYTHPGTIDEINLKNGVKQEIGLPIVENGRAEIRFITITVDDISFNTKTERGVKKLSVYSSPSMRTDKKEVFPTDINIVYESSGPKDKAIVKMRRDDITSSIENGMPYFIVETGNNLLDAYKGELDPRDDFVEFLEKITLTYLTKKYSGIKLLKLKTMSTTTNNSSGENEGKHSDIKYKLNEPSNKSLKDTYNALNKKGEYRPHCVARALQLLDSASLSNKFATGKGTSRVCEKSLGKAARGTSLSDYVPSKSLGQLYGKINPTDYTNSMKVLEAFVQKDSTGLPISIDQASKFPGEKDDLQSAIKRLTVAFGLEYKDQKSFSDIKVDIPVEQCKDKAGKEIEIDRNSNLFRNMKSSSQQLLAYHLKYIIEISKFLKKIFNISQRGDGTWQVQGPKTELLFAGYDTLDMITNQARTILLDYYAGCEEIYQKGLKTWKNDTSNKVAADETRPKAGMLLPTAPPVGSPPVGMPPVGLPPVATRAVVPTAPNKNAAV